MSPKTLMAMVAQLETTTGTCMTLYDFLVCNYRPSKLPMHESDVWRDYKDLDECAIFSLRKSLPLRRRQKVFTALPARMATEAG